MADSTRIPGEQVNCHECSNVWPREQGGLQCPRCESEFVEIISDSNPPSPELPPRHDSFDDMRLTRSRSLDSLEHHNAWQDAPDPDEDDIGGFPFARARPPPREYHWESRSPNGSSSFSFSMYNSNGGPVYVTSNRGRGGEDPAMMEVEHDFQDLVQTIMGITTQRTGQNRGTMPGGPALPGFPSGAPGLPSGAPGQLQPQGQDGGPFTGLFGTILQGLGGVRVQGGADANGGPFAMLQRMMDPANAAHGDAVFTQEALDRVITQLMEQSQGSNAPGPATEAAIKSLPKKTVDKDMLDDFGNAECSICMDAVQVGDQVTVLPCTHWFHETCITAWLKEHDTCPHCRKGISTSQPEATGSASRGPGQPRRPPRRSSSGAAIPGGWQGSSGTAQNPVVVEETSPGPQDIRAARQRYYRSREPEVLERRDTGTHGRRSSRSTPSSSSSHGRRHHSESHRSGSNGNGNGGGFGGWVRSFGGGGGSGER